METIFLDIANLHAPLRLRRVKSEHCPWMTNNIKNLAYHKYYFKKKQLNSTLLITKNEAYKRCRNELNEVIKATKSRHYNTKLQNSKTSKEGWNTLNNFKNRQSKATTVNELNIGQGNKITDKKD